MPAPNKAGICVLTAGSARAVDWLQGDEDNGCLSTRKEAVLMSDGLQELMARGVVISGNEAPVTTMGAAEGIHAFATWLEYARADGSVSFDVLARAYCQSQGWQLEDTDFRRKLRTPPDVDARYTAPLDNHAQEPDDGSVPVHAPTAVVLDPSQAQEGVYGPENPPPVSVQHVESPAPSGEQEGTVTD